MTRRAVVRIGDDLEEAPARTAGDRVGVALQFADVVEPAAHRRHLVAVGLAHGLQRAQHAVLVDAHDHQPQPGHPRPLHPAPIRPLVGQVRRLPLGQRRIAARVVRIHGRPVVEEVLERRRRSRRPLDRRAVGQRRRDPVRMPRPPAVELPAEVLERHPVHVAVDQPTDAPERRRAPRRRAGRVQSRLREDGAARRLLEPHRRDANPGLRRHRAVVVHAPVGGRAGSGGSAGRP